MWTAALTKDRGSDGGVTVNITYTDGTRTVIENLDAQNTLNDESIATHAQSKIDWLTAQDASFDAITEGPVTPQPVLTITPTPVLLTPDQQAQVTFLNDYRRLQKANKAIGAGFLTIDNPDYQTLLKKVDSEFQFSYLDLI